MDKRRLAFPAGLEKIRELCAGLLALIVTVVLAACASTSGIYRQLTPDEQSRGTILGSVQVEFEVSYIGNKDDAFQQAYVLLLREASRKYEGNIDVRDITLTRFSDGLEIIDAKYMAVGKVVIPLFEK
jgi:uncharacterized lipoprotein YehR (DUF1307 family)